ncbi:roadblock/LC7 domain-containing protein [Micromonospora sp. NBC_01813]|uniref:roadblock/LC7 domain-containing protein n=1 Tax=Micromonospora sp. NBC_01813 TaxID=2975988 RepID=UPI002DD7AEF5|nr:roadblock/LC7 domain-containing protein [Micromonospora sp. NBC_01813]WSA10390.1 roadblock/LC7 domain-containing protein [Micromonospora sp. NBC_01813]
MAYPVVTTGDVSRLLDDLVERVPQAQQAVALSPDGILLAWSKGVDHDLGEQLSGVVAGLRALAVAVGQHANTGRVRQIVVQMGTAFLFIAATPGGAIIAALFDAESDIDSVAYEVALFAGRADRHLPAFPAPEESVESAGSSQPPDALTHGSYSQLPSRTGTATLDR